MRISHCVVLHQTAIEKHSRRSHGGHHRQHIERTGVELALILDHGAVVQLNYPMSLPAHRSLRLHTQRSPVESRCPVQGNHRFGTVGDHGRARTRHRPTRPLQLRRNDQVADPGDRSRVQRQEGSARFGGNRKNTTPAYDQALVAVQAPDGLAA